MIFEENVQEDTSTDKVIYTDHEITKAHIWAAYEGLKTFYSNWDMNRYLGREKKYLSVGVYKYVKEFLLQIKYFLEEPKIRAKIKNADRALRILNNTLTEAHPLTDEDIHFIRFFSEDFLAVAGMKNISRDVSKVPTWLR